MAAVELGDAALADEAQLAAVAGGDHRPAGIAEDRGQPGRLAAHQLGHGVSRRRHVAQELERDREVVGGVGIQCGPGCLPLSGS